MRKTNYLIAIALLVFASCDDAIYDYDDDCHEGIQLQFVYDYNLEWADAFSSKVDCLTVLFYNQEGKLIERRTETSENLRQPSYRMTVDLPAGQYHVVAYGGMECSESSFSFTQDPSLTDNSERTVYLSSSTSQPGEQQLSQERLHDLYHGMADLEVGKRGLEYSKGIIEMMKNTNNFRILLVNANGTPLKSSQFNMSITDDNTLFAHDNSLLPSLPVEYRPWISGEIEEGVNSLGETLTSVYGEISTSRLISRPDSRGGGAPAGTSSVKSPRLTITRTTDGGKALDIPLIDVLGRMMSMKYSDPTSREYMPGGIQEFLDRKSQWDMTVVMGDNLSWLYITITVDDWTVRINKTEL